MRQSPATPKKYNNNNNNNNNNKIAEFCFNNNIQQDFVRCIITVFIIHVS